MISHRNGRFIVVKSWQTVLIGLGMATSALGGYAVTRYQTEENSRRIEKLEEQQVRKEQLEDVQRRLQRIEDKLDQEHTRRR